MAGKGRAGAPSRSGHLNSKPNPQAAAIRTKNTPTRRPAEVPPTLTIPRGWMRAAVYRTAVDVMSSVEPYDGEYRDDLGEALAVIISYGGTLDNIETLPGAPPVIHMLKWIAKKTHPFSKLYYGAKDALVPLLEERAVMAATTALVGVKKRRFQALDKDGCVRDLVEESEYDNVERSKLIVNTFGWALRAMAPRRHGPKPETGDNGENDQLNALFESLRAGPVETKK